MAEPKEFEKLLEPLDDATKAAIMHGTAEALFAR
jgi:hypothetical protein